MKKSNKDKYYMDKDDLWSEIENYYKLDDENLKNGGEGIVMPNSLGTMIMQISNKIMTAQNFSGYPYRDQMEGDAYFRMVMILTKRKFNLWSHEKVLLPKTSKFRGWKYTDKAKQTLKDNPSYKICLVPIKNDDNTFRFDLLKSASILKPNGDKFVKNENGTYANSYEKVKLEKDMFEQCPDSTVVTYKPEYEGAYDKVNDEYEVSLVKNNAFGYLSLIATREAVTRIKKETKNFNAIHDYQEQEFVKFLSENPEMAPQKIDDDTYEIS